MLNFCKNRTLNEKIPYLCVRSLLGECLYLYYMDEKRILVVDDEPDICEILQFNLENAGYGVDVAYSAEAALGMMFPGGSGEATVEGGDVCGGKGSSSEGTSSACPGGYSLVLLDVMMGGMSGFRMADILRKEHSCLVPIIFLTAKTAENDLLTGFSAGGDDYICKPFSVQEVLARVRAVLRRCASASASPAASSRGNGVSHQESIRFDLDSKLVYVEGNPVTLSKKEFELLRLLVESPGRVFSREEIIAALWKDAPYVLDRTIDVHIARIRSRHPVLKSSLVNRSGYGYLYSPQV